MRYKMNDSDAGGIYNGISESDIAPMLRRLAGEAGISHLDYDEYAIARELSKDKDIAAEAKRTYVPYPLRALQPSSEEKARYAKQCEAGTAPGKGDVHDGLIEQKARGILARIFREVVEPRLEQERKEKERREEILSHVVRVETEERDTEDEGGKTKMYIHSVLMPSGNTYRFMDRNVFDVGRVVTYDGKLLIMRDSDGKLVWDGLSDKGERICTEASEHDEDVMAYRAARLFGFSGHWIRM